MEIRCDKCGCGMGEDSSFNISVYKCWNCGNRHYPGYPKRPGTTEICATCGEEFERISSYTKLCDSCKETDKSVIANRKRQKKIREMRNVSAM